MGFTNIRANLRWSVGYGWSWWAYVSADIWGYKLWGKDWEQMQMCDIAHQISYPQNLITCYKQDLSNVQSYLLFATTHLEFVLCHNACPPIILARIVYKENVI
jgi:hypothetical protein